MLYSPVAKVSRIRNHFAPAIKKALKLASVLSGNSLMDEPIYIDWPDTLPRDPKELAEVRADSHGSQTNPER